VNPTNPTNPQNLASPAKSISLERLMALPVQSWNALPSRVRVFLERLPVAVSILALKVVYNLVLVAAPTVAAVLVRVGLIAVTAVQPWPVLRTFHAWGVWSFLMVFAATWLGFVLLARAWRAKYRYQMDRSDLWFVIVAPALFLVCAWTLLNRFDPIFQFVPHAKHVPVLGWLLTGWVSNWKQSFAGLQALNLYGWHLPNLSLPFVLALLLIASPGMVFLGLWDQVWLEHDRANRRAQALREQYREEARLRDLEREKQAERDRLAALERAQEQQRVQEAARLLRLEDERLVREDRARINRLMEADRQSRAEQVKPEVQAKPKGQSRPKKQIGPEPQASSTELPSGDSDLKTGEWDGEYLEPEM
jgi:hypothetical protein